MTAEKQATESAITAASYAREREVQNNHRLALKAFANSFYGVAFNTVG